jgi:zinc transport system substrate-binding protein
LNHRGDHLGVKKTPRLLNYLYIFKLHIDWISWEDILMRGLPFKVFVWFGLMFLVLAPIALAAGKISIFVSIPPQKYHAEKIGGELVAVSVMAEPGTDPHTFEPKPQQMVSLSQADIYFAIGIGFEKAWLKKIKAANPRMQIVHTDIGIQKFSMTVHLRHGDNARNHTETMPGFGQGRAASTGKEHHPGSLDPHVWLSPPLVMIQARHILNALVNIDPAHLAVYAANYRDFLVELADLDLELINIFSKKGKRDQFIVFHPAWGYFAHAYGLEQVPIEFEGKDPKPAQLIALIDYAKIQGIKVIFVQPQFSTKSAQIVAQEIGGQVVLADPLALDWADNIRRQAAIFKSVLIKE